MDRGTQESYSIYKQQTIPSRCEGNSREGRVLTFKKWDRKNVTKKRKSKIIGS